jgi:hypothetical protein
MANSNFRTIGADFLEGINADRNYIKNAFAKDNTLGWATYKDAAQASPVDGTGGTAALTFTRSTTTPLRGDAEFLITKAGSANLQGEGAAYAFTIDRADQARVMQIDFDYIVRSGTYTSGDLTVWVYDVTNAQVIQPSAFSLENAIGPASARLTFQTASNSTSYRLIFHQAATNTNNYTLGLDNLRLGPQVVPMGAPVTDWVEFTPTISPSTNATATGYWRRVGDSAEITGRISWTGAGSLTGTTVSLPAGLSIDTNKIRTNVNNALGVANFFDQGVAVYQITIAYNNATSVNLNQMFANASAPGNTPIVSDGNYPATPSNNDVVHFRFSVPIAGWSSSTVVSSSADTRVVAASVAAGAPTTATNTTVQLPFGSTLVDTHAGRSGNSYVVKVPGLYRVVAKSSTSFSVANAANTHNLLIRRNGSDIATDGGNADQNNTATLSFFYLNVNQIVSLVAGDSITVHFNTNYTGTTTTTLQYFNIERLSGPSQIAASEVIAAVYRTDAGQTIANTGADVLVNFEDRVLDTHNAVTTGASWRFTAPAPGFYEVSARILYSNVAWTAGSLLNLRLRKNGSVVVSLERRTIEANTTSFQGNAGAPYLIEMLAGDFLDIVLANDRSGGSTTLLNDAGFNYVTIKRLGGVG